MRKQFVRIDELEKHSGKRSLLQFTPGPFKFLGDEFFVWKDSLIFSSEDLVGEVVEGVVSLCCSLFSAQNESDWRGFARFDPVFAGVILIEVHLSSVRVTEFANFEVHDHERSQTAMKENEVDPKPGVVNAKPALTAKEGKIVAQL